MLKSLVSYRKYPITAKTKSILSHFVSNKYRKASLIVGISFSHQLSAVDSKDLIKIDNQGKYAITVIIYAIIVRLRFPLSLYVRGINAR